MTFDVVRLDLELKLFLNEFTFLDVRHRRFDALVVHYSVRNRIRFFITFLLCDWYQLTDFSIFDIFVPLSSLYRIVYCFDQIFQTHTSTCLKVHLSEHAREILAYLRAFLHNH